MASPQFFLKGIDKSGEEVRVSPGQFTSLYRAELASLEFYGDPRYKLVWVERSGYGQDSYRAA